MEVKGDNLKKKWLDFTSLWINAYKKHEKKCRFLIAGAINTAFGLLLYPFLYLLLEPLGLNYLQILLLSQAIGISFAFISHKYFVFKTQGNIKKEYSKFLAFHLIYLGLNLVILPYMVTSWKFNPMVAQTLFAVAVILSSYFWHNSITFKSLENRPYE
jgi:putative flippase GtrA